MNRDVHIICQEVPWPPIHSKAIDTLSQIKGLHASGVKIHLHYFCSDVHCHPTELNRYCESIHVYPAPGDEPSALTSCNSNKDLYTELSNDNYPLLFEGIYCTGILNRFDPSTRKVLVRMYDDECSNCENAAKMTSPILKKIQLQRRARGIREYEKNLSPGNYYIFSIREHARMFQEKNNYSHVFNLPLLHPFQELTCKTGVGSFCLYHGDLSDPCNEKAVRWLITEVFTDVRMPVVIAGRKPGKRIQNLAHLYTHSCLVTDPSPAEMQDLVSKAHIHVLPSFSYKRPELKLLHSLHGGRHCVVNENAVNGTALKSACYIAENANGFKSLITELAHRPFEEEEIELRQQLFKADDNKAPVDKLISWLFN